MTRRDKSVFFAGSTGSGVHGAVALKRESEQRLSPDAEPHHGLEATCLLRFSGLGTDVYMRVYMERSHHCRVPNEEMRLAPAGTWCIFGMGW